MKPIEANTQIELDNAIERLEKVGGGAIRLGAGDFRLPKKLVNIQIIGCTADGSEYYETFIRFGDKPAQPAGKEKSK